MRTWLFDISDLADHGATCTGRYEHLANALVDLDHQVLRWAPTTFPTTIDLPFTTEKRVLNGRNYAVQFVHSAGHHHPLDIARQWGNRLLARHLRNLMDREATPDLIVATLPSLEWAAAAADYGRTHHVPVVIDVCDSWPDSHLRSTSAITQRIARFALGRYHRLAQATCRDASALVAVSQSKLDWALDQAGRPRMPHDMIVPIGSDLEMVAPAAVHAKVAELSERGIEFNAPICLFLGEFDASHDLETVVEAADRLSRVGRKKLQFVLCGDGSKADALRRRAAKFKRVHFLNHFDAATLQTLAPQSIIGICPYRPNAVQNLPIEWFEYMARRLAIVSSLEGEPAEFLRQHSCGLTYNAGNVNALTNAINRLVLNPATLESMQSNSYDAWAQNYRSRDLYARFAHHLMSMTRTERRAA